MTNCGVDHEALAVEAGQRLPLRAGNEFEITLELCHEYARRSWRHYD